MTTLASVRETIDSLDSELLKLVAKRMSIVKTLKPIKAGRDVADPQRETILKTKWIDEGARQGLAPEFTAALLGLVLAESKRLQRP